MKPNFGVDNVHTNFAGQREATSPLETRNGERARVTPKKPWWGLQFNVDFLNPAVLVWHEVVRSGAHSGPLREPVAGGYRLGASADLPPLLLNDDEAVTAVTAAMARIRASPSDVGPERAPNLLT